MAKLTLSMAKQIIDDQQAEIDALKAQLPKRSTASSTGKYSIVEANRLFAEAKAIMAGERTPYAKPVQVLKALNVSSLNELVAEDGSYPLADELLARLPQ